MSGLAASIRAGSRHDPADTDDGNSAETILPGVLGLWSGIGGYSAAWPGEASTSSVPRPCVLLARNQRDEISATTVATVRPPHHPGDFRSHEHHHSESRCDGSLTHE
jgi:hypothetical protein